jgi:iron complex outermembrane receptor protein
MVKSHNALRRLLATTALIGSGAFTSCAFAQAAIGTVASAANAPVSDEIIVTAARTSQKLEDVPAAVIAVTGSALQTAGVTKFQDLAVVAPGVQVGRSGSYTQAAIRGVSTTFAGGGQETNVAIYVDGFYTSDQLSSNQDFANIQDIQVLKGPQGTLYGRNATGGAILITTRSPTNTFEADVEGSYAPRYRDDIFHGFVGGPIANGIKFSIAGSYHKSDGYFKDINSFAPNVVLDNTTYSFGGHNVPITESSILKRDGNDAAPFKNWSIRPKLVIEPTSNLKVTLGYVHTYVNDPRGFAYVQAANPLNAQPAYNGYAVTHQRDTTSLNFQPQNQSKADEYNATVALSLGSIGNLVSRSAYRKQDDFQVYDLDATPADSGNPNTPAAVGTTYIGIQFNHRSTFTQQLDYSGDFGAFKLLAGLFYYRDKFATPEGIEDIGTGSNPTATQLRFNTRSYAGYVDGTYGFNDKLFITVGARYSHDQKELFRERYNNVGVFVPKESSTCYTDETNPVFDAACNHALYKATSNNAFTPRAVIRYNLSEGTNVYASVSRGFKAGTLNTASPFNALLPETVTAYEAGFKTKQHGFRGELSGFYYNYKNNQISALNAASPSITTLIQNSGGARIYGIDASLAWRVPNSALNLRAGIEYLHARFTDFGNATDVIIGPTGTNTSVIGSWTGRRLARAPDWSGSFGADYTLDLFGGKVVASGTATFSSRYAPQNASYQCTRVGHAPGTGADIPFVAGQQAFCDAGTNGATAPGRFDESGYILANAQIAWTDASNHLTVTVFSDNLSNTRYKIIAAGLAYQTYEMYNEPRTVGFRVGFKY